MEYIANPIANAFGLETDENTALTHNVVIYLDGEPLMVGSLRQGHTGEGYYFIHSGFGQPNPCFGLMTAPETKSEAIRRLASRIKQRMKLTEPLEEIAARLTAKLEPRIIGGRTGLS